MYSIDLTKEECKILWEIMRELRFYSEHYSINNNALDISAYSYEFLYKMLDHKELNNLSQKICNATVEAFNE